MPVNIAARRIKDSSSRLLVKHPSATKLRQLVQQIAISNFGSFPKQARRVLKKLAQHLQVLL